MKTNSPSASESIRLFKNPALEFFTHVHPIIPALIWVPVVAWFTWDARATQSLSLTTIGLLFFAGMIFWTLAEYILHRYLFHFQPIGPITERLIYLFHGIHHDTPNDATRLVMPPVVSIFLATLFYFFFLAILGPEWTGAFFAGFLTGYLAYDYIHYATHHYQFKSKIGKSLKKYHMVHHFADHDAKWGVSSPLWDVIFRTTELPKKK